MLGNAPKTPFLRESFEIGQGVEPCVAIIPFLREPNGIFPEEVVHGVEQRVVIGGDDQLASARLPEGS